MFDENQLNKIFGFFLNKKGVVPKFRKTKYGYRTYNSAWKLFKNTLSIVYTKPTKIYNGCDYDNGTEETRYQIIKREASIDIVFLYTKII
ncbi:hypothetical protein [Sulfurimonas sp.]|uniref:hypothetical protein n=1 Tax=Sulfurimonas sp. TaxID=2022749 RepID=UPI0025CE3C70|nr:hypothetical protein [Sulfurimonas sp.]MBW6487509.1 hypothetical protein [Sulfurimonas sp.]